MIYRLLKYQTTPTPDELSRNPRDYNSPTSQPTTFKRWLIQL